MRRLSLLIGIGCLALATPRSASAQGVDLGAADAARIHLGPVGLKPSIVLDRLGLDSNVGHSSTDPERDFMMTVVPGVESFLPIGRGLLSGRTSYELNYFKRTSENRSGNVSQTARFDLGLTRFTPYVLTEYLSTNRRPSVDLDERVHQVTNTVGAGASAKVGGRTDFSVSFVRSRYVVDHQTFADVDLADALGRRTDTMTASFDRALTPLTTLSVVSSVQHDRFPGSSIRNADTLLVAPVFAFKPSALLSGHASVGLMRYHPLDPALAGFTGLTAAVDLSYVWRDWTKFNWKVNRNVSNSFDNTTPYFVVTNASVEIAQHLGGRYDLLGRFGRDYLNYREVQIAGAPTGVPRQDRTVTYGLGLDYRLSDDTRVGFNVDYDRRMSPVESRHFDGYRFGGTFTYAY